MAKIEDLITNKIYEIANVALNKLIKPDITIDSVIAIDEKMIMEIKEKYKIEALILDVDETLRENAEQIPKCNQEWIDMIKKHFKIIVLSNGLDKWIADYFANNDIKYIGMAFKPLRINFIRACIKLKVNPRKIMVIGDNTFDDIFAGKKMLMKTAKVNGVD